MVGTSLMFQQLLVQGRTSVGVKFSERELLEEEEDGKEAQDAAHRGVPCAVGTAAPLQ